VDDGLSVLPIAQASVLRWVLMGGNINESNFFGMAFTGCVLVPVRQPVPLLGVWCCVERCRGVAGVGLCLAHCWVLRQQDLFAAMHLGASSGVSFVPASGVPVTVISPAPFWVCGLWWVGCG
jgi:hypothetical protein